MTDVRGLLERAITDATAEELCELAGVLETYAERAKLQLRRSATPSSTSTTMLSAEQIGEALGVKASAVSEWARAKKIPSERYGRFVRFDLNAVRAALTGNSKFVRPGVTKKARPIDSLQGGENGRLPGHR